MLNWTYEPMYVVRNEHGVVVRFQEEKPVGFVHEEKKDVRKEEDKRFRPFGD